MNKMITLTDEQYARAREAMETTTITSFSEFFRFLVLFYEQNQKRTQVRAKSLNMTRDDSNDDDNDEEKYAAPDYPQNKSRYSYGGLKSYYEFDKRRGKMPPRSELTLHPDWVKENEA